MFILMILEKIKVTRLKFSQGSVTVLQKMTSYQEIRVKLSKMQLNKLKSAGITQTTCDDVATSHLGLIYVGTSRTMLRRHHDVATGTSMRRTYLRYLCNVSLIRK